MKKHIQRRQRGVALVELALMMPLLLMLTLVVTELGRAMYQYSLLTRSVRDAVRYASVQAIGTRAAETQNLVVYGTTTAGTNSQPLVSGLTLANVSTPAYAWVGTDPVINTVTVSVTGYCFQPMMSSVFGLSLVRATADCSGIPFGTIAATMRAPS